MAEIPKLEPVSARGRGRPKVVEPRTTVCTWMDARHYDQLVKMANARETSVSALVREIVVIRLG